MMKIKVENTKIETGEKWPVFVGIKKNKTIVNDKEQMMADIKVLYLGNQQ